MEPCRDPNRPQELAQLPMQATGLMIVNQLAERVIVNLVEHIAELLTVTCARSNVPVVFRTCRSACCHASC